MAPSIIIHFLIVGGGLTGLSTAIALRKSGHKVTLLEANSKFTEAGAGIQVPPNCTAILQKWNILHHLAKYASKPHTIELRSHHGHLLSTTNLVPDVEGKFGAPYLVAHRADLLNVLVDEARALGTEILLDSPVQHIDFSTPLARTRDGREYTADVIIGSDGEHSFSRQTLLGGKRERILPLGKIAYRFSIDSKSILSNPALSHLAAPSKVTSWLGSQTHVVAYNLDSRGAFNVVAGFPDSGDGMSSGPHLASPEPLRDFFRDWDPALQELLKLAGDCLAWRLMVYPDLKGLEWTHADGKFVLIGDAAHAMPPHLAQGAAQGIEDAAWLGQLFSRPLRSKREITQLLRTFYARRYERVTTIRQRSMQIGQVWALSDGPEQEQRDKAFAHGQAGIFEASNLHPDPFSDPVFSSWLYGIDVFGEADMEWTKLQAEGRGSRALLRRVKLGVKSILRKAWCA